jgi:predicted DNA-binding ribbon-helix-helix protein
VGAIDSERQQGNLSSAIRLFVFDHYQARPNGDGQPGKQPGEVATAPPPAASVLRAE